MGIKIAVSILILDAGINMISKMKKKKGMSPILLIVISAVCGVIAYSI